MHEDQSPDPSRDAEIDDVIWRTDNVVLTTVGIDVGSATSHLMFSRLHLRRQGDTYSSRFRVVSRRVLHRSTIRLTPYRADGSIDAQELERFVEETYRAAGLARAQVDAGAVILTGVALERRNARAIAELFAAEGGRFVCATAGHNLEAVLAAHGSGAVGRSAELGAVLNVDVGGGTTKLAWCTDGQIAATMAISGGARLVAFEEQSRVVRLEPELLPLARDLGIELSIGRLLSEGDRTRLADALAARIVQAIDGTVDPDVVLAGQHPGGPRPDHVVLSGGVAELIGSPIGDSFDDLGPQLATSLEQHLRTAGIRTEPSVERIRATVIGASQFAVQLSGNTVHVSESARLLPVHGLPVVSVVIPDEPFPTATAIAAAIDRGARLHDLDERTDPVAIAIRWDGEPRYERLRAIAEALASTHLAAARRHAPLVVALQADIAASLGSVLTSELGIAGVVAIDGLELNELDYIDIGEQILPAGTLPVVIKSLVFAQPEDAAASTAGTGGR